MEVKIKNNECESCKNLSKEFGKLLVLLQTEAPELFENYLKHLVSPFDEEDKNEGKDEIPFDRETIEED